MPASVPHVDELGVTSAPLKSASFFIGEYCKPYNGACFPFPSTQRETSADEARGAQRTSCCVRPRVGIRHTASQRAGR